ncbi:tRNA-dihydrouridine(16/17) synthase [NAD(P)(+)]-like, partial [Armadillidium vulgare]
MASEHPGFEYWRNVLKKAKHVLAPMVDACGVCYTPMLHASVFVNDSKYRKQNLASCSEDRPLIVQFCANNPETFAKACSLAAPFCDGVDINLGCPQAIARKGHYGAFLMEEWTLISDMIRHAKEKVSIPISAKIRVFSDLEKTIQYAKMLESAGVMLLTVHGRTRDQKGPLTGVANWDYIKAVREAVSIPVFANGNIQYLSDVSKCLEYTGVQGVMSAEGNLHNPAIFVGESPPVWRMALEYLDLVKFNMEENFDLRYRMSKSSTIDTMIEVTRSLEARMKDYYTGAKEWHPPEGSLVSNLPLKPWLCQPYVRMDAEDYKNKLAESQRKALERRECEKESNKRELPNGEQKLSRKKMKKLQKNPFKKFNQQVEPYEICKCKNPRN